MPTAGPRTDPLWHNPLSAVYHLPVRALRLLMFLLAAVIAIASTPSAAPSATVQATATIRVMTAVRLKLDAAVNPGAPSARDAVLRLSDGTTQSAKLIEFQ